MAELSKITTPDGTTYDIKDATARANSGVTGVKGSAESSYRTGNVNITAANVGAVAKSGDTMTGNLIVPAERVANTYYGISFGRTNSTPEETILYTGIKWVSSSHMPVLHFTGYAYGLQSPVEFKIGFYIYADQIGYCGVTNMGSWAPDVYLFKYTRESINYVAVGLSGRCYFLQLQVDVQDEMGKMNNIVSDSSAWTWEFLTTTGNIPDADYGVTCIQVPYKADILHPNMANATDTLSISHGGTGATSAAAARTNLGLGSAALAATAASVGNNTSLPTGSAVQSYVTGLGYEANQNAFSNVIVGSSTIAADSKTDSLTFAAGDNITLTPDTTNDKITIKATDTTYSAATTAAAGLMSASDKVKLNGIAAGAQVNPTYTAFTGKPTGNQTPAFGGTFQIQQISQNTSGQVSGTDRTVTIPNAVATLSSAGLMSASDKEKLSNIATGAEVNQNAFSNVKVGSTTIAADAKTDTLELAAGANITLTPDATNDKVTIAATDTTYESKAAASGGTAVSLVTTGEKYTWNSKTSNTGTVTSVATGTGLTGGTITTSGTISLATVHSTAPGAKGDTANQTPAFGGTFKVPSGTVDAYGRTTAFAEHTVTIPNTVATTAAAGLMSAADKTELNNLSTNYQAKLISGTNIKTINNQSILGSGNITISGGSSGVQITLASTAQPLTGSGTQSMSSGSNNAVFNKMQLISPINGFAIITGSIQFTSNASKTRHAQIECMSSDSGGNISINICADGTILAASGAVTRIPLSGVCQVTVGSTIRVQGWQNSGSALNVGGQITVMYIENAVNGDSLAYGT